MIRRIILVLAIITATLCFTGCQTMHGLGGDLQWTGEQIEAGASNFTGSSNQPQSQPK
jgi:predicted small secreted protein